MNALAKINVISVSLPIIPTFKKKLLFEDMVFSK